MLQGAAESVKWNRLAKRPGAAAWVTLLSADGDIICRKRAVAAIATAVTLRVSIILRRVNWSNSWKHNVFFMGFKR